MKPTLTRNLLAAVVLSVSASVFAASVGVNFLGDNSANTSLAPTDSAGFVVQTHWNNINSVATGNVGLSDPLTDNLGNPTGVQLQFDANDAWSTDGPTDTPNEKLMKGTIKEGNGVVDTTMILSFTNLSSGSYDVYVYGDVNGGPVDLDVSIGAKTNYWSEPDIFYDATGFSDGTSSDPSARGFGNYIKFLGVSPVSGAITMLATYRGGGDGLGIAGLQLISAGGFTTNTTPVAIVVQPQAQVAPPGGTATFSVSVSGPGASYQWFKNGNQIQGATGSSYTSPTLALTDNGAKFKVTVRNNVNSVTSDEAVLTVMNDPGTRVGHIGANFLGSASPTSDVLAWQLASTETAGAFPQPNWNNINFGDGDWGNHGAPPGGYVGIAEYLRDSAGNPTTVMLRINCNDAWNADGPTDTPDARLMKGVYKQAGNGSSMTITLTNLTQEPAFFDIYVYGNVDTGPEDVDLSIGGTTYYWTQPGAFDNTTRFMLSDSTDPSYRAAGNYVKFSAIGATPASSITITATVRGGPTGLGIAGVQVLSSAAFPANTVAPAVTQQPVSTYAIVGGTATFTVGLNGPWSVQWRRDGMPITGATDLTYTTPPLTLSDSGARFDVAITNNVGSTNSLTATVTVDALTPAVLTQGFLTVQRYTNITGEAIAGLYADPNFPNTPATVYSVPGADVPQTVPDLDNFGAIAWGWLVASVTADYTFFIRSDDHSAFFINTNGAAVGVTNIVPIPHSGAPGSDLPVCEEGDCCQDFLEPNPSQTGWHAGELAGLGQTTLTPIHLEAGKLYGICLVYKEGGGDDYVQLAWRADGDSTPAASLQPIPMVHVWTMASPAGNRVSITEQPQSTTVLTGATATLSVNASTLPTPDQWAAQWLKNGNEIPGATGDTYTTPALTVADSGTTYRARIIALAGVTNSATAIVSVTTNLTPKLTIRSTTEAVTIGWDSNTGTLESTSALAGDSTVWAPVGPQNPVTLSITRGESRYYRVRQ